jgi:hypothetical protein
MDVDSTRNGIASTEDHSTTAPRAKLIVTTSPRLELMLVAAMLAAPSPSPGHYGCLDHPIAQAARRWFTPFADHPAVASVRQLFDVESASGVACDALVSFILRRGEPPGLDARYPHSKSALARADGDSRALDRMADQLCGFYRSTRFASFWEEQTEAYRALEEQVAGFVQAGWAGEDVVTTIEDYFGQGKAAYVLMPTPMERPGGGSMDFVGDDGDARILACFDGTVDKEWVLYLLYHEVGHSFVNPLAERHDTAVKRYEGLHAQIGEVMRSWGYINWVIALNEHILRAQNCHLCRQLLGDAAADAQLGEEESHGFRYVRVLEAKLSEYEAKRDLYPSLADFYPTLLTALDPFLMAGEPG